MDFKVESSDATNNNGVGISMPLIDTLQSPMDIQNLPNAVGMEVVDCGSEAVGNANLPILYVSSGYDPLETSAGSSQAANTSGLELEDSKLLLSDSHVSSTSISPVNEATLQIALTSSTSSHDHSNDIFYSASEDQNLVPLDLSSTSALNSSTSENKQDDLEPNTNPGPSLHNFYENFGSRLDETVEGVEQSHNEEIDASKIMVVEENNTHPMDENEQEEEMDVQVIDDEEPGPSIIMNPDNVTNRRAFTRSMGSVKKNQDEKLTLHRKNLTQSIMKESSPNSFSTNSRNSLMDNYQSLSSSLSTINSNNVESSIAIGLSLPPSLPIIDAVVQMDEAADLHFGSEAEGNADNLQVPNLYCSRVDPLKASALSEAMTSTNTSGLPSDSRSDSLRISSTGQIQSPVTDETESKNVLSSSINQSDEILQSADERSHIPLDLPSTSEFNSHVIEGKQEGPEANSTPGSSLHSFYEDFGARLDQTAENVAQSHDEEIEVSDAIEKSEGANPLQDENEMDVEAIDEEISEPSIISEKIPAKRAFTRSMGFINEDPDWQRWITINFGIESKNYTTLSLSGQSLVKMQNLLSPDQLEIANSVSEAVGHANLPTNRIAAVYVTGDPFESVGPSQAPNPSGRDLRLNVVSDSHVSSTSNLLPSLLPSPVSEALPENIFAIVPNITSNTSPSAGVHLTRPTSSNFSGNFEELLNEASRRVLDAQSNNEQEQDEASRVEQNEPNIQEEQDELEVLKESSSSDESDERDSGERAYTRSRGRVDEDPNAVQKTLQLQEQSKHGSQPSRTQPQHDREGNLMGVLGPVLQGPSHDHEKYDAQVEAHQEPQE
ncbi:hypothetical protein QAD02_001083 [Eretmocerus hayati]|uniref:Uncharacterized protein n=1 Tax=Eretmocerus hayati TaxID=131215 RepID=A0ACC2NFG3_9HYME|nr:hypothetical protein QAD02_001083 [Eretmocerus hayati]